MTISVADARDLTLRQDADAVADLALLASRQHTVIPFKSRQLIESVVAWQSSKSRNAAAEPP